ncbi:putative cysteine protease atg4 [Lineolata rhizophorae]|uniref:Cysteine protease n=1 Tax=Lineolata rhizophorae TaxID=578093 RepID=A0A6A6P6S2_9PEZI|nr:putative cysteine protease atg4 [Lineolata rhizophorae]
MSNVDIGRYSKRIVQYFWDPPPRNDDVSGEPIWCLGMRYDSSPKPRPADTEPSTSSAQAQPPPSLSISQDSVSSASPDQSGSSSMEDTSIVNAEDAVQAGGDGSWPTDFLDDFESRIWLTYRCNFPLIPKSQDPNAGAAMSLSVRFKQLGNQAGFTSDSGWGCMIRSGQSLLANAMQILRLGRDWRRGQSVLEERRLLSLFADDPRAPFSIHRFVEHGASACGKHPGEWFGPSATARCIQALTNEQNNLGLRVYITGDGSDVYEDSFFRVAKTEQGTFQPTLVLVGIRLGIDRVTPVYWEALKSSLQMPQSIGIAGGRPSSSHYFVGTQGPYFFYLDPHQTRPVLPLFDNMSEYSDEDVCSCHTRRLRRIRIREMDPSMLIAFLIKSEDDWRDWRRRILETHGKPIVHVADHEPTLHGHDSEREGAIDEVEAFDDDTE